MDNLFWQTNTALENLCLLLIFRKNYFAINVSVFLILFLCAFFDFIFSIQLILLPMPSLIYFAIPVSFAFLDSGMLKNHLCRSIKILCFRRLQTTAGKLAIFISRMPEAMQTKVLQVFVNFFHEKSFISDVGMATHIEIVFFIFGWYILFLKGHPLQA